MDINSFLGKNGAPYTDTPLNGVSWVTIPVMTFLNGKTWSPEVLGMLHALRPTRICVTNNDSSLAADLWAVNVFVDEQNVIEQVTQHVEVGVPDHIPDGDTLLRSLGLSF